MGWRIDGQHGTWLEQDDRGRLRGDIITLTQIGADAGVPVPQTPTGPYYHPTGPDDPVGVYLLALWLMPGPLAVTGTPPQAPPIPAGTGVVY